jgi:hypothetical protein
VAAERADAALGTPTRSVGIRRSGGTQADQWKVGAADFVHLMRLASHFSGSDQPHDASMPSNRASWIDRLWRICHPVLSAAAEGRLHRDLPIRVAAVATVADRGKSTHLEAIGRTLAGLAPWLEVACSEPDELRMQSKARNLTLAAVSVAVDPEHPDRVNFSQGHQAIVDAAFLSHAVLRAPTALQGALDARSRRHLADALACTRDRLPYTNNWLLFAAIIEAALYRLGERWDPMRVDHALRSHERWYVGDGTYGDGSRFHWDYYNSFVIHPMLVDVLDALPNASDDWQRLRELATVRFVRAAEVQERMIAPDGSFPPLGRSLTYRCGAFQLLAQAALQHRLPHGVAPEQVRCALDAVIRRTLDAEGTFDADGWLMPGLCGHQPGLMERYISTGSLYLASNAFLPLGLAVDDAFWSGPDRPWTQVRIWRGDDVPADHALHDA